jgi:hypothetical protein
MPVAKPCQQGQARPGAMILLAKATQQRVFRGAQRTNTSPRNCSKSTTHVSQKLRAVHTHTAGVIIAGACLSR